MPTANDPYSRPINATRTGTALVGEHYGRVATDKARSHAAGRVDATGVRALPSVVPVDLDAPPEKTTRKRKVTSLNADVPPVERLTVDEQPITEDDLFG